MLALLCMASLGCCALMPHTCVPAQTPMTTGSGPSDLTEFELPVVEARLCNRELPPLGLCVEDLVIVLALLLCCASRQVAGNLG